MNMDTRLGLHVSAQRRPGAAPRGGAVPVAGVAALAVVLAGVLGLVFGGHGASWSAGLIAGAAAAAWATAARGRRGSRASLPGAAAARRTELALLPLEHRGWRFLHRVSGPDGTYDHLALGPGGLILLESMCPDGPVTMNGGQPVVERPGGPDGPPRLERLRPKALADAMAVRETVQRIAGRRMWVQAVVVFWSDFPAGCVADGRCVYIHGSRLAEWISRRPTQFDEPEFDEVYAAVRVLAEHGGDAPLRVAV
jgi:hypothetical protein